MADIKARAASAEPPLPSETKPLPPPLLLYSPFHSPLAGLFMPEAALTEDRPTRRAVAGGREAVGDTARGAAGGRAGRFAGGGGVVVSGRERVGGGGGGGGGGGSRDVYVSPDSCMLKEH